MKQVKTVVRKPKATQKPQAQKSGGQPKKGSHHLKCPASDESDDLKSSGAELEEPCPWQRKRLRRIGINEEEVKEEENEKEVKHIGDDINSEDIEQEQVSLL